MLKGYESQAQVQQATAVSGTGLSSTIQASQDFTTRLKEFQDFKEKQLGRAAQDTARDQAFKDAKENKPFNKKVNNIYGSVYNEVRTATYAADAELMIANTSTKLLMQHENEPEAYDNAMKSYVDGLADTAPTSDLQSVIAIGGHKRRTSSYGKLKIAEHGRIQAAKIETFSQSMELAVNQIIQLESDGDMERAEFEKKKNLNYMKSMNNSGLISDTQVQKIIKDAEYKITYGTAINNMEEMLREPGPLNENSNAYKYLQGATAEARGDMSIAENKKYNDDLTKMFNNEVKSRKASETNFKEEANLRLGNVIDILKIGKAPTINQMNEAKALAPYASLSKQDDMNLYIAAYDIVKKFDYMSLPEQEAAVANYKSTPEGSDTDVKVIAQAKANLASRRADAKKDPMAQGVAEGRYSISPINVSNGFGALMKELPNRVANQQKNKLEYSKNATSLFTEAEASEWAAYLESADTPMSEKIDFMRTVTEAAPNQTNAVFNQLRKKGAPLYTFAASLVEEGKDEVAKGVLRGQGLLKAAGPQEYITEFRTTLLGKMGNAMIRANTGDIDALVDSSLAYSLYLAESKGDITNLKGLSERQAINDLTNGMYKRNKQDFFMPDGASKDDFDEWIDEKLTIADFANIKGHTPEEALLFTRGNRVRITSVGAGKYALYLNGGLEPTLLQKTDGTPLILEY